MHIVARKKARGRRGGALCDRATPSARVLSFAAIAVFVVGATLWLCLRKPDGATSTLPTPPVEVQNSDTTSATARQEILSRHLPSDAPAPPVAPSQGVAFPSVGKGSPSAPASVSPAPSRKGRRAKSDGIASAPGRFSFADMTFSNHADAVLGNLLTMEYGEDLIGDPEEAYKGFSAAFDKALEQPIAITEDDDDFQRELKEAVIELREELAQRRAGGEDIEEILADSWRQMKELSLFRQDIESQVKDQLDDDMTQEDYERLIEEANRILEEEGIKPLELPSTLKRALRLRQLLPQPADAQE